MKELYFFDETFYWNRSGKRATVIEAECELTYSVRPDELRQAVVSALRVHRNFRARPVIVGRRFYVEDSAVTASVASRSMCSTDWPTCGPSAASSGPC